MTDRDNKQAIEKLQSVLDIYEKDKFTPEELTILHRMIDLWKAFEMLGKVADTGRNVVIWVAGLAFLWFTPFDQVVKGLKKMIGFE